MKNILTISIMFFTILFISCGDKEKPEETISKDISLDTELDTLDRDKFYSIIQNFTYDQKEEFEKEARKAMAELNRQIDTIKANIDNVEVDFRDKYRQKVEKLKERKSKLENKLKELSGKEEGEWEEFKYEVRDLFEDIQKNIDEMFDEFHLRK